MAGLALRMGEGPCQAVQGRPPLPRLLCRGLCGRWDLGAPPTKVPLRLDILSPGCGSTLSQLSLWDLGRCPQDSCWPGLGKHVQKDGRPLNQVPCPGDTLQPGPWPSWPDLSSRWPPSPVLPRLPVQGSRGPERLHSTAAPPAAPGVDRGLGIRAAAVYSRLEQPLQCAKTLQG